MRNNLNVDRSKTLVYVQYKLRLLFHYCEVAKIDKTYLTWDNHLEEANMEDGSIALLERLEDERLGDHDGDRIHTIEMPHPTTTRFSDARVLFLASQHPSIHGVMHLLLMF